eukprot:3400505-Ditylum_brightwellii.AAC.1
MSSQNPSSDDPLMQTVLIHHTDPYLILGKFVLFQDTTRKGTILYPVCCSTCTISADITALLTWMPAH